MTVRSDLPMTWWSQSNIAATPAPIVVHKRPWPQISASLSMSGLGPPHIATRFRGGRAEGSCLEFLLPMYLLSGSLTLTLMDAG